MKKEERTGEREAEFFSCTRERNLLNRIVSACPNLSMQFRLVVKIGEVQKKS